MCRLYRDQQLFISILIDLHSKLLRVSFYTDIVNLRQVGHMLGWQVFSLRGLHKLDLNVRISDQPAANVLQVKIGKMDTIFYRRRQASCGYDCNTVNLQVSAEMLTMVNSLGESDFLKQLNKQEVETG